MWYARKRGEAAEEVTGSCRKKFSNIIPKGRPIRTAGPPNRPAVPRRVNIENDDVQLNGVKKTDIIIIQQSYNNKGVDHIKQVEKEHRSERILKSEGVDKSNVLSIKRR